MHKNLYQKNQHLVHQVQDVVKLIHMKQFIIKYKKPIIITTSLVALQLLFGFDPKFTIINIVWLFV
jgi:hypothetical protein